MPRSALLALLTLVLLAPSCNQAGPATRTPEATPAPVPADPPGRVRTRTVTPRSYRITLADLPRPFATPSASQGPDVVPMPDTATLRVPPGFVVNVFAEGLGGPRQMVLTPEGEVLVAESSAGRLTVLTDANRDGAAEARRVVAGASNGLNRPFGLAFAGGNLYVGNVGNVTRFAWTRERLSGAGTRITDLPTGGHWTRNVVLAPDGRHLFVAVGSRSNVDREELPRASILRMRLDGSGRETFASGLRNAVGLAFHPRTGDLYAGVQERDGLGDDLVPDYVTRVQEGAFYGWPYAYLAPGNVDPRRMEGGRSEQPDLVARTVTPDVLLQAHSSALGLVFYTGTQFPARYRTGAFVAMRGSWNRSEGTGYKIAYIPFEGDRPTGGYEDFVTGFLLDPAGPTSFARPVGLVVLPDGSLLLSEDGNGRIYRISYAG
jgi:glucose/arabinose dehydrogenase